MRFSSLLILFVAAPLLVRAAEPALPTVRKPVFDEYQGVKVEDDYQWLEKDNDPAVKAWSDAQNRHTRAYLDKSARSRRDRETN